jgi:hypothetical protein
VNPDEGSFDENSETAGGNFISEGHGNLHADWDAIPKQFGTSGSAAMVELAQAVPQTAGAVGDWAATWASDTVVAAHTSFDGLSFTGTGAHKWSVEFDDRRAYVRAENKLKQEQLAKGGARLAQLLNAIWPLIRSHSRRPSTQLSSVCRTGGPARQSLRRGCARRGHGAPGAGREVGGRPKQSAASSR